MAGDHPSYSCCMFQHHGETQREREREMEHEWGKWKVRFIQKHRRGGNRKKDHGGSERGLQPWEKRHGWKRLIHFCDLLEILLNEKVPSTVTAIENWRICCSAWYLELGVLRNKYREEESIKEELWLEQNQLQKSACVCISVREWGLTALPPSSGLDTSVHDWMVKNSIRFLWSCWRECFLWCLNVVKACGLQWCCFRIKVIWVTVLS